ncbi:MAG: prepilin-type N-terminal cleavage/methylation domain-containing protein [Candidatus Moranbacteria bacterium]|nr:prepilin-type N-terminal cleavage/methylation domain-containing protein [Candidatus Moranbacteria bacterium]
MNFKKNKIAEGSGRSGFTLVEVMVAIAIFSMGMAGFSYLFYNVWETNHFVIEEGETARLVSRATDEIVGEIRKARQSDDGSYPIKSGGDFDLVFYSDIDDDNITERVHYFYEDNQLKEGSTKPSGTPASYPNGDQVVRTIASYIVNTQSEPVFHYYNSQYPGDTAHNPLAAPVNVEDVRLIQVHLYANINPNRAPDNINIESFAELRNINEYGY